MKKASEAPEPRKPNRMDAIAEIVYYIASRAVAPIVIMAVATISGYAMHLAGGSNLDVAIVMAITVFVAAFANEMVTSKGLEAKEKALDELLEREHETFALRLSLVDQALDVDDREFAIPNARALLRVDLGNIRVVPYNDHERALAEIEALRRTAEDAHIVSEAAAESFEARLKLAHDQHQRELDDEQARHARELEEVRYTLNAERQEHTAAVETYAARLETVYQEYRDALQRALTQQREALRRKLQSELAECDSLLEETRRRHAAELAAKQAQLDKLQGRNHNLDALEAMYREVVPILHMPVFGAGNHEAIAIRKAMARAARLIWDDDSRMIAYIQGAFAPEDLSSI